MQRKDQLIRILLESLAEKDRSRSELTNRIKNYEPPARELAISEMLNCGLVEFYLGKSGKGRRPVVGRITQAGLERLQSLRGVFKDRSVWSA